jgi:MFS transporter, OFA family, oxalate/formate antiporter
MAGGWSQFLTDSTFFMRTTSTSSAAKTSQSEPLVVNRGWLVTFAGTGINLALGVLYAWSIFKGAIEQNFGWNPARLNDPYALCCLAFAFSMILAGRCQDKLGPRITAFVGGLLVGLGLFISSMTTNYWGWVIGFGLLAGIGIGFGYSSATPPALKWFPASKTGLIAGLVVAGFGLASVYIAPLSEYLLNNYGVLKAMLFYSIFFVIVVCGLSMLLVNPPPGYVPGGAPKAGAAPKPAAVSSTPGEMLRCPTFYLLWVIYFVAAGAGLMVISSVSGMAKASMGQTAFVAVALLAVGNAAGRIVAGMLSDKIGRRLTLMIVLLFQAGLMFAAIPVSSSTSAPAVIILSVATLIGFNYGANLALFPSLTKDFWGLKNFGMNYGILFTSWGVGGFFLSRLQQMLKASSGSFTSSFVTAGLLLIVGAALALMIKHPQSTAKT